ncbi:unnamed protein product [Didymodactylos carnosus]|uniref:Fringe-like glycosyltransferase domain-containing protein n=1 Tax=Didymodactylos carnosus TaxID=1234261 RepID=A0A813WYA3_9BILA|nr:unnamed protein product [Didymodactylos carnosus]CAF3650010.1 unnamed protein product [Didymodactylos carnosus]
MQIHPTLLKFRLIPNPNQNWLKAHRYQESDIAFVIYTSSKFYHTRAMALRDTWLSRVTNYYFLSSKPYSNLPVTVIKNAGEDYVSNMKKIFYGLQLIYGQQISKPLNERQKWYYLIGCDTYVNVRHLLKRLESYDYQQIYYIGGHTGHEKCYDTPGGSIIFPSGGGGFLLSFKLLEKLQVNLTDYLENKWPNTNPMSDVALACLIKRIGHNLTQVEGFWSHTPAQMVQFDGFAAVQKVIEPNNWHYVMPADMINLDEFYSFQYVDRLANDQNLEEMVEFIRLFIKKHYEILRKKHKECTLPPVT